MACPLKSPDAGNLVDRLHICCPAPCRRTHCTAYQTQRGATSTSQAAKFLCCLCIRTHRCHGPLPLHRCGRRDDQPFPRTASQTLSSLPLLNPDSAVSLDRRGEGLKKRCEADLGGQSTCAYSPPLWSWVTSDAATDTRTRHRRRAHPLCVLQSNLSPSPSAARRGETGM